MLQKAPQKAPNPSLFSLWQSSTDPVIQVRQTTPNTIQIDITNLHDNMTQGSWADFLVKGNAATVCLTLIRLSVWGDISQQWDQTVRLVVKVEAWIWAVANPLLLLWDHSHPDSRHVFCLFGTREVSHTRYHNLLTPYHARSLLFSHINPCWVCFGCWWERKRAGRYKIWHPI